jgi:hypothetical protein
MEHHVDRGSSPQVHVLTVLMLASWDTDFVKGSVATIEGFNRDPGNAIWTERNKEYGVPNWSTPTNKHMIALRIISTSDMQLAMKIYLALLQQTCQPLALLRL